MQRNTRIGFESILALGCTPMSINMRAMQCNALYYYIIAYCELAFFHVFFLFRAAETGGGEYGEDGDSD